MDDAAFISKLVEFFTPKVVRAAREGFAWREVEADVLEILAKKAKWRTAGLGRRDRLAAMHGFGRLHQNVIDQLREVYPKSLPENN